MRVTFIDERGVLLADVAVERGTTVLEAARKGGVALETPCGGKGTCGKCRVRLADPRDIAHTDAPEQGPEGIAACATFVFDGITVVLPEAAAARETILAQGFSLFSFHKENIKPFITKALSRRGNTLVYAGGAALGAEAGDTTRSVYGLAFDIGTTTLAAALADLRSGAIVATETALNPQTRYAHDLISRIEIASTRRGLETLYNALMETMGAMIRAMTARARVSAAHIYEAVYSGNTVMLHIASKTDPSPLGRFPATPRIIGGTRSTRADRRLGMAPRARIYLPPLISGFVGADISAGMLAVGLGEPDPAALPALFIDIGTNGEMVAAKQGALAATSAAAGPAFEGTAMTCGMRAGSGAVDDAAIDGRGGFSYRVFGNGEARGICGSGFLALIGELARVGVIEESGRFAAPDAASYPLRARLCERDGYPAFAITDTVYLDQRDVRRFQSAKAAIRAGITVLLERIGAAEPEVATVLVAGAFGYHARERSLLDTGILPRAFAGKVRFAGNTSLSGAAALLLNTDLRERARHTAHAVKPVDLAGDRRFAEYFIDFMSFPPAGGGGTA